MTFRHDLVEVLRLNGLSAVSPKSSMIRRSGRTYFFNCLSQERSAREAHRSWSTLKVLEILDGGTGVG